MVETLGAKELDAKNNYKPDLENINESAERTYGEASSFFKKEELYLKEIERQIITGELLSEKQIYDESHAIASDLAKCCEMYLKALFLYEHKDGNLTCKELWSILEAKMKEDKTKEDARVRDENGNIIYYQTESDNETPLRYPDGKVMYVYAKVDSSGHLVKDANGNQIYIDELGNEYEDKRKGRAVKTNGHALDRLVELIDPASRLLLETRMLTIPMETTEENRSVSILDKLQENGIVSSEEHISQKQFAGWLDQHKKTFEESRFSGQRKYDVSVEFMYHLATQIRAVVQYAMVPQKNQQFTITNEELSKLPFEIRQLASFHSQLISEDLIKLVANNEEASKKIKSIFSKQYILPKDISQQDFYKMIQILSEKEITYISEFCYLIENYKQLSSAGIYDEAEKKYGILLEFVGMFNAMQLSSTKVISFLLQIKETLGLEIGSKDFYKLFRVLRNSFVHINYNYDINNKEIEIPYNNNISVENINNNNLKIKF